MWSVPLAYYASFLAAVTGWDFRFLVPASLLAQVLTLAFLLERIRRVCTE